MDVTIISERAIFTFSTVDVSLGDAASRKMATLMNSSFFVLKISLLRNYRVKCYDYIVKWCSGIVCDWSAPLDNSSIVALNVTFEHFNYIF